MPEVIEVRCPATGELIGSVQVTPPEAVRGVVDGVRAAQQAWARVPLAER